MCSDGAARDGSSSSSKRRWLSWLVLSTLSLVFWAVLSLLSGAVKDRASLLLYGTWRDAAAAAAYGRPCTGCAEAAAAATARSVTAAQLQLIMPSSAIAFLPWKDAGSSSSPSLAPEASSLSRLPVCGRSLHWQLLSYSGFGSQLTSILASANFARMTGRAFFLHSDKFAYGAWAEFFVTQVEQPRHWAVMPEPRSYSRIAALLHDTAATNNSLPVQFGVEELMDQWPIAASAPHPTPLDPREEDAISFDAFMSALQRRRLQAAADGSTARHPFGSGVCAFALQPDLLSHPRARSVPLCRSPPPAAISNYAWPRLFPSSNSSLVEDAVAHVSATLLDGHGLHSMSGLQLWRHSAMQLHNIALPPQRADSVDGSSDEGAASAARLLSLIGGVNPEFFWSRRRLRSVFSLKSCFSCQAERLMRRWNIRGKLDSDDLSDVASSRSNLSALFPSAYSPASAAASASSSPAPSAAWSSRRRYVAIHLRRGDKEAELRNIHHLEYAAVTRYVTAAEAFIAAHAQLNASWPLMTRAAVRANCSASLWQLADQQTADLCAAWWEQQDDALQLPQPHVLAVSDDPASYATLRRGRPCWRWMFPSEHELWAAERREWQPASARPAVPKGGHQQWTFNSQPEAVRLSATASVLVDLLLLSMADCVVLTLSSNIGRMVALSRGWWDVWVEHRLSSLDELVQNWRPY